MLTPKRNLLQAAIIRKKHKTLFDRVQRMKVINPSILVSLHCMDL